MKKITYTGWIRLGEYGDNWEALYLENKTTTVYPLAEELQDDIEGKFVSVRYWVFDNREVTLEEAELATALKICGKADTEYQHVYSEYTGYLWTNQKIEIGGHDLLDELESYVGKYLVLEIIVHKNKKEMENIKGGLKMPNFSDDEGRYWYKPRGKRREVQIPHPPIWVEDDCTCIYCTENEEVKRLQREFRDKNKGR